MENVMNERPSQAPRHIALYGKGGVGTTTTAANVSVALAEAGYRVMQVGFDPRHNSTGVLRGDRVIRTVVAATEETGDAAAGLHGRAAFTGINRPGTCR
jgi:nitrogenase iron protein NifH